MMIGIEEREKDFNNLRVREVDSLTGQATGLKGKMTLIGAISPTGTDPFPRLNEPGPNPLLKTVKR